MYPGFCGTDERARSNHLALRAKLGDFQGCRAARACGLPPVAPTAVCVKGLVMGDHNAPCFAQGAHRNILSQDPDVYAVETRGEPRCPAPLGTVMETLTIDDRVGIAAVPAGTKRVHPALAYSFDKGN